MTDDAPTGQRVADAVIARRVALGYTTRNAFAQAVGVSSRVLSDLENANRDNFDSVTIARMEQALRWLPGSVAAIAAGGKPRTVDGEEINAAVVVPQHYPMFVTRHGGTAACETYDGVWAVVSWRHFPGSPVPEPMLISMGGAVDPGEKAHTRRYWPSYDAALAHLVLERSLPPHVAGH